MRISFESEAWLIHSKYIFPNRVAKKKHKSSKNSIDFKNVSTSLESVFFSAHQTLGWGLEDAKKIKRNRIWVNGLKTVKFVLTQYF